MNSKQDSIKNSSQPAFDVLVIGGGPGGYVAAIRASQLGMRVAVVERDKLGGICLNWGCIPTKSLLRSAEIHHFLTHASDYGLSATKVSFDVANVVGRSRAVSSQLQKGVEYLMKKNKIEVLYGTARLAGSGEVAIEGSKTKSVTAKHIIIATGGRPRELPFLPIDGKNVISYFDALIPTEIPAKLLVVGSGAIGIEFASFYAEMGSQVTVVEIAPQILPAEDAEIAKFAKAAFVARAIDVRTSTKFSVESIADGAVTIKIQGEKQADEILRFDRAISAVGVTGNVENLGLEGLGVRHERGVIEVDSQGRTSVAGIYAIGDVAGPPMLAHKAEHEGVICVEAIAGLPVHAMNRNEIPGCTYCNPSIASIGMTEAKARDAGFEVRVGRFNFGGNGKALAMGEKDGMVKTIFDNKTGRLLGAHMIGAEVTEMIQGFAIAMKLETTEEDLMSVVFPHPTISETMHESVLSAYGKAIHS